MNEVVLTSAASAEVRHRCDHPGYEYVRRDLVPMDKAEKCALGLYELPPGKSAYPYHYHLKNEEVFYILKGEGLLKTPAGARTVSAGDAIFFPACAEGAHKITNVSDTETLVYLDFDVRHDLDACFYPDSGKIGVYGRGVREIFETKDAVDYYKGE